MSHVRLSDKQSDIHSTRVGTGSANLVIGCDLIVTASRDALSRMGEGITFAAINSTGSSTAAFVKNPDWQFPGASSQAEIVKACGADKVDFVDAGQIATALMGDSIATNMFMLGYAWQKGLVPISYEALSRAIELNGAAVEMNKKAFAWGRMAAHDLNVVKQAAGIAAAPTAIAMIGEGSTATSAAFVGEGTLSATLDESIELRAKFLTEYQDAAYADDYANFVRKVRITEAQKTPGETELSEAVARYLFKLMAIKDEYEVARLYTTGDFQKRIRETFDGDYKVKFNLAPPLFSKRDSNGHLVKKEYGPWVFTAFKLLVKLKGLRGGTFDIFGKTEERRMERQLIVDYRNSIDELLTGLTPDNHALAVEIARLPEHIRGYGHVKEEHYAKVKAKWASLIDAWRNPMAKKAVA
jgi:indolepyruvate ferredoxin oxidoreductase